MDMSGGTGHSESIPEMDSLGLANVPRIRSSNRSAARNPSESSGRATAANWDYSFFLQMAF